jgi:prenyltransferase beta subunit
MKSKRLFTLIFAVGMVLLWTIAPANIQPAISSPIANSFENPANSFDTAASPGVGITLGSYLVIHESGLAIPSHGDALSQSLGSEGLVVELVDVSALLSNTTPLNNAMAVILDASLGSDNGTLLSDSLLSLLVEADKPVILMGRSAWLLHRLRGDGLPQQTALASDYIYSSPTFAGAVFLSRPYAITDGTRLTQESLGLPQDRVQTASSRIVNLTSSAAFLPILRYDSYPLDSFLIGMEDPAEWTAAGLHFLVNVIAYCTTFSESTTSTMLASNQGPESTAIGGGFTYYHEPSLASAYSAVHSLYSMLLPDDWATWTTNNRDLIQALLDSLYVDLGSQAAFMDTASAGDDGLDSTSQGLWLATIMGLSSQFDTAKIISYLSNDQAGDGGFGDVSTTYYVTESLSAASSLSSIDTASLESWLRTCVITGADTSDPTKWGGVASTPTGTNPQNNYAAQFVLSLGFLGASHNDPMKLTSWILTGTQNGDGSFDNSLADGSEPITGTSSALITMQVLGTLSTANRTAGLAWLLSNQLSSGGFGVEGAESDIIAKTEETSRVALCVDTLGITDAALRSGIESYMEGVKTPLGFEGMELVPSIMWGSWIAQASRFSHAGRFVNLSSIDEYLALFTGWSQYPQWANITAYVAPEYGYGQFRTKGVWSEYFGATMNMGLGITISSADKTEAVNYIEQCQSSTGHFRPTLYSGTAQMQETVAAVETLYQLDSLDAINYRSALDTAVLSEYNSGTWSSAGWTMRPFMGSQAAIDWLSTRATLRLGLVNTTMASEIASAINARIHNEDLWSLSRDIATLALLNSTFQVGLSTVNTTYVSSALNAAFTGGWYNSSVLWQPLYTEGILEMISILGLRPLLHMPQGSSAEATAQTEIDLSDTLDIAVSISSSATVHSVYVHAFGSWTAFENVTGTDTLHLAIHSDRSVLGPQEVSIMVWDFNASRSYAKVSTIIMSSLSGSLVVSTPSVIMGDLINGTVMWNLETGGDAGTGTATIRLGDSVQYHQWSYQSQSPLAFSIPTDDFSAGQCNLTVLINVTDCHVLVLEDTLAIYAPNPTYIASSPSIVQDLGGTVDVGWSLRFQENDTYVVGQSVTLTVANLEHETVYTSTATSDGGNGHFYWNPSARGNYTFIIAFERNGTLEGSVFAGSIDILQTTNLTWTASSTADQYKTVSLVTRLTDSDATPLLGMQLSIQVISPSSTVVYSNLLTTNSSGYVSFSLLLTENGIYTLLSSFSGSSLLHPSSAEKTVTALCESQITVGGIAAEGFVNTTWKLWAILTDSVGIPVSGVGVEIRVLYLPSTLTYQTTLATNATGGVSFIWSGTTAGPYEVQAEFAGTYSRGAVFDSVSSYLRIPVTLSIVGSSGLQVGVPGWCLISAVDHNSAGIDGLTVMFVVRDLSDTLLYQTSGATSSGLLNISWTPSKRGVAVLYISVARDDFYEASSINSSAAVYDTCSIVATILDDEVAISSARLLIQVLDSQTNAVESIDVHTIVELGGAPVLDVWNVTDALGNIQLSLLLTMPGILEIRCSLAAQDYLEASSTVKISQVLGCTYLTIVSNGLPVSQASSLGFTATLLNWRSMPFQGVVVTFRVLASNGTVLFSTARSTGTDGRCAIAYTFNAVGDFVINANYSGSSTNAASSDNLIQRVTVKPSMSLLNPPTSMLGDSVTIQIGIKDALGSWIVGKSLQLVIHMGGVSVFQSQTISTSGLVSIHWTPSARGAATIELSYAGDTYVLYNSAASSISIMELVSGSLLISPSTIGVGNETSLTFTLNADGQLSGIAIEFVVLDQNLIAVWSSGTATNGSGVATAVFHAVDITGVFSVVAGPSDDQFMVGGDAQVQLSVMTHCQVTASLTPAPASLGGPINITVECKNELGGWIDGLTVKVSLYFQGQPIKLGYLTNWASAVTKDGFAYVEFEPQFSGSYQVVVESSGSTSVYAFTYAAYRIVHNPTTLQFISVSSEIEVGDQLQATALLTDYYGDPLVGRDLILFLGSILGPVNLTTNATGYIEWSSLVDQEGMWVLKVEFKGIGVYLPASITDDIDVRYGTQLFAERVDTGMLVAGGSTLNITVLLQDTGGTPLEGRTISYKVYHSDLGLLSEGSTVQTGQDPELVTIPFDRMGAYTVVFSFSGTEHYHPSSTAIDVFVHGTSQMVITGDSTVDRSSDANVSISLLDERGFLLSPSDIQVTITMNSALVDLSERLHLNEQTLDFALEGLSVGLYMVDAVFTATPQRLGCESRFEFNVTSSASLNVSKTSLSGLLGQVHSITAELIDSLEERISNSHVYVSVYDPTGHEIYGSIITTRTLVEAKSGLVSIEWTPTKTGNYSVIIDYEGTAFISSTTLSITVLVRYETHLDVTVPTQLVYPDSGRLMATLSSGAGKVSNAELCVEVAFGGVPAEEHWVTTDIRGLIQFDISPTYAGNMSIRILYAGSDINAGCTYETCVLVEPAVELVVSAKTGLTIGTNGSILVDVIIGGVMENWSGTLAVDIYDSDGTQVKSVQLVTASDASHELHITPTLAGVYTVYVNLANLPIIGTTNTTAHITVGDISLSIPMEGSNITVMVSGAVLGVIGLLLRRKLSGAVDGLSAEWDM